MPKQSQTDTSAILIAALRLAAEQPWPQITLEQIAKAAKRGIADVERVFPHLDAIPPAIAAHFDAETVAGYGAPDLADKPQDRLFEILMARFDVMQQHRAGILSIAAATRRSPQLGAALIRRQWQSMQIMLAAAAIPAKPGARFLQTAGLLAVYHHALQCWVQDVSSDMSKTMARLDRDLRRVGKVAEVIPCNRQAFNASATIHPPKNKNGRDRS